MNFDCTRCGVYVSPGMQCDCDRERDALRAEIQVIRGTQSSDAAALRADNTALRAALARYGSHERGCRWAEHAAMRLMGLPIAEADCTCGLDAALNDSTGSNER